MPKVVSFTIPGEPKAKQRPRVAKGHAYTPEQTVNYENWVKACYLESVGQEKLEGEIRATIVAYFKVPKSASKKDKLAMLSSAKKPTKKPDVDNIAKIILDPLNLLAYDDDKQIVELRVAKRYSEQPRVEVQLEVI